jgi:hypothetical protein
MAYDTNKLYEQAVKAIKENNLFFIEDVVALLPCSKPTFYDHIPVNSNEFNNLKELIEENRVSEKLKLRKKWSESDNATLQMGLMKLITTDEERKRLATSYMETNQKHTTVDLSELSTDDIVNLLKDDEQ